MSKEAYCPTHVHTEFSLLDSCIKIKDLVAYCKELGMKACAITDHSWCAGLVTFYKECQKVGIKALLGCEPYITNDPDGLEDNSLKTKDNYHLVLIAKDNEGLKILYRLCSNAAIHNFYYKPRITKARLKECIGHIICTSACLLGEVCKVDYLTNTTKTIEYLQSIFKDDFYLELQDWDDGTGIQQQYNRWLLKQKLQYVITTDAHYLKKEDHALHELMMAMQLKKTLKEYRDEGKMVYGKEFYIKTPEEMWRAAQELDCPSAYDNTIKIAEQCSVSIELGKYHMPQFDITKTEDYSDFLTWKEKREKSI